MLTQKLISDRLKQSKHNPVLFTKTDNGEVTGVVIAHVDDLYVTGTPAFVQSEGSKLDSSFKMSKSGPLDTYLSLKVDRDADGMVYLSQLSYINQIVESHLPVNSKPAHLPCNSFFSDMSSQPDQPVTKRPYSKLMGMLQWVANGTWPDIQFATNRLSQFV